MDQSEKLFNCFAWEDILDEIGPVQARSEDVNDESIASEFALPIQTICPECSLLFCNSFTGRGVDQGESEAIHVISNVLHVPFGS